MFVEWSGLDPEKIVFVPTFEIPTGFCQIVERYMERLAPLDIARLEADASLQPDTPAIPQRPTVPVARAPLAPVPASAPKRARR